MNIKIITILVVALVIMYIAKKLTDSLAAQAIGMKAIAETKQKELELQKELESESISNQPNCIGIAGLDLVCWG